MFYTIFVNSGGHMSHEDNIREQQVAADPHELRLQKIADLGQEVIGLTENADKLRVESARHEELGDQKADERQQLLKAEADDVRAEVAAGQLSGDNLFNRIRAIAKAAGPGSPEHTEFERSKTVKGQLTAGQLVLATGEGFVHKIATTPEDQPDAVPVIDESGKAVIGLDFLVWTEGADGEPVQEFISPSRSLVGKEEIEERLDTQARTLGERLGMRHPTEANITAAERLHVAYDAIGEPGKAGQWEDVAVNQAIELIHGSAGSKEAIIRYLNEHAPSKLKELYDERSIRLAKATLLSPDLADHLVFAAEYLTVTKPGFKDLSDHDKMERVLRRVRKMSRRGIHMLAEQ